MIMALMLMAGFAMNAQKNQEGAPHKFQRAEMTPEQMATLQSKKMAIALDLSAKQQQQVYDLNLERAQKAKERMDQWKAKKANGDAPQRPTAEQRFQMKNAMLDNQLALQDKMKQILNPDQYDQWKKMRHHKADQAKKRFSQKREARGKRK